MNKNYRLYIIAIFGVVLMPLLIVLICNMFLYEIDFDNSKVIKQAVDWQLSTHGVVSPPLETGLVNGKSLCGEELFKIGILKNQLAKTNTLILGSSTAMGIRANMFPSHMHVYNFAHSGQLLSESIEEAQYFKNIYPVKWLVIDLDWYLGYLYLPNTENIFYFSNITTRKQFSVYQTISKIRDALSLPRIKALADVYLDILKAKNKKETFVKYFSMYYIGKDYQCPDGTLVKDFNRSYIGKCLGFRQDGSSPWGAKPYLDSNEEKKLYSTPFTSYYNNAYLTPLQNGNGFPTTGFLDNLAKLSIEYKKKEAI